MGTLVFSSKEHRRDSIRKLSPIQDKQYELRMIGRVGSFDKKVVKNEEGRWEVTHQYEPSYVYKLYLRDLSSIEEKLKLRKTKIQPNE